MNPYRYAKKIRTEWLHEGGGYPSDDLNIDLLLERATVPLCQRIDALKYALEFMWVLSIRKDGETVTDADYARLRAILEDSEK